MRNDPSAPSAPPARGFASLATLVSDVSGDLKALEQPPPPPAAAPAPEPVRRAEPVAPRAPPSTVPSSAPPRPIPPSTPPSTAAPGAPPSRGFAGIITLVSDVSADLKALELAAKAQARAPAAKPVDLPPSSAVVKCITCGTLANAQARSCPNCRAALPRSHGSPPPPRSVKPGARRPAPTRREENHVEIFGWRPSLNTAVSAIFFLLLLLGMVCGR